MEEELVRDVALLIPAPSENKEDDNKDKAKEQRMFYTVPFGFPLIPKIEGEHVSLFYVIKLFPINETMANLVEHYETIKDKDMEELKHGQNT